MKLQVSLLMGLAAFGVDGQMMMQGGFGRGFVSQPGMQSIGGGNRFQTTQFGGGMTTQFGGATTQFVGGTATQMTSPRAPVLNPRTPATTTSTRPSFSSTTVAKEKEEEVDPKYTKRKLPKTKGGETDDIYEQNRIRNYNLKFDSEDWSTLNADPTAEAYVPCNVTVSYGQSDEATYIGAGCRYKGSVGSLLQCISHISGQPNGHCRRFGMKVDANKYRTDSQKIDGAKRLQFHGMAVDESLVSERVTYNVMQELGMAAPRAMHSAVYINGKFDTVYAVVEEPNSAFTERNFDDDFNDGDGGLYKDYWFLQDQSTDEWLDNNRRSGKNEDEFLRFVRTQVNSPQATCSTLKQYIDTESVVNVTAFNDLIGQTDDWRFRHNFYWYVKETGDKSLKPTKKQKKAAKDAGETLEDPPTEKKMVLIPWDYDRLTDEEGGLDFRRDHNSQWFSTPSARESKCAYIDPLPEYDMVKRTSGFEKVFYTRMVEALPLGPANKPIECDKFTQLIGKCLYNDIKARMKEMAALYPPAELTRRIDMYVQQISPVMENDEGYSRRSHQKGVNDLKKFWRTSKSYAPKKTASSVGSRSVPGMIGGGGMMMGGGAMMGVGRNRFGMRG